MNAILSVKPEYASKILSGEKLYEYRKSIFRRNVKKVYIYASSPICMIVGEFQIDHILQEPPTTLWDITQNESGVTKEFFNRYFKDKQIGFAIRIKKVISYPIAISPFCLCKDFIPPQNYIYVQ